MTRFNSIRAFAALGISAALLAAPPAFAKDPVRPADGAVSATFRYEPSDVAAENYLALRRAVDSVCLTSGPRPIALRSRERECVRETLDKAVAELGSRNIQDLHLAATDRRPAETRLASARR